jgi:hypothetical protein
MSRKYLAFDIETAKVQPVSERDWKSHRPLGISCAATLMSDSGEPLLWHGGANHKRPDSRMNRHEVMRLVNYLARQVKRGYTIVTWNGVGFDFDILAEESGMLQKCIYLAGEHVDMMFHVLCQLGYAISLDSAARGMDLVGKKAGMTGALAPRFWAEGRRKEVLEYVAHDVQITLQLAQICESQGYIRWVTRSGRRREVSLPKGWLPVSLAERLPEPCNLWMCGQWSRTRFTAWLRERKSSSSR